MTDTRPRAWMMPRSPTPTVFTAHVNVGFCLGARLADPSGILEGHGTFTGHVKLRPGRNVDNALAALIQAVYADMKTRL